MDSDNSPAAQEQVQIPDQVIGGEVVPAAGMGSGDWRNRLQADCRQRIVNKVLETLKRHLPFSGEEGLQELKKIVVRFEEKIYTEATSQSDYLRKISLKMLTMETKSQNPMANSLQSNAASNSKNPQDSASQTMQSQMQNQVQQLPIPMVSNHSQVPQQLLSENIKNSISSTGVPNSAGLNSTLPSVGGMSQGTMPNVPGQNPNMQNIQNMSNVTPNAVGNSMGQVVPSNIYANSQRQIQSRQQEVVTQEQQQQNQNSKQFLYNQQLQQHLMKQKLQQGISLSTMKSLIQHQQQQQQQQQQQNLLLQSFQQSVMQPSPRQTSASSTLQNQQTSLQQSTQSMQQQQSQSVLRQQQQQQQPSIMHHQQASMPQHPMLPTQQQQQQQQQQQLSGEQPNTANMQQNQLIGQQNSSLDAQQHQQQQSIIAQQNNISNMQQQETINQQNELPNMRQQHSTSQQLQQQTTIDQQKLLLQSLRVIPDVPLTSLDSSSQTGNASSGDWQEEIYQKIKSMNEMYFPELNDLCQRFSAKLQQYDALPQQTKTEQHEKLKFLKFMLERLMQFLRTNKNDIQLHHKEKAAGVEKQIVNILNSNKPQKPVPSLQPGQLTQPQIPQMHMSEGQMNSQMQQMNVQGSVVTTQQLNTNPVSSQSGLTTLQSSVNPFLQANSNLLQPQQATQAQQMFMDQRLKQQQFMLRQQLTQQQQLQQLQTAQQQLSQLRSLQMMQRLNQMRLQAPGTPFSISPQIGHHHSSPQSFLTSHTKAGTPLQSANSPFIVPSPSTKMAPSPMPGDSEKVVLIDPPMCEMLRKMEMLEGEMKKKAIIQWCLIAALVVTWGVVFMLKF